MRARYYNQDIKRFINRDVVSGDIGNSQSLNRYCYVQGNPVSLTDPFGLCPDGNADPLSVGLALMSLLNGNPIHNSGGRSDDSIWSIWGHTALDVLGIFWDGADLINAAWYALEGNWEMAIISGICALPFVGNIVGGTAGLAMKVLGRGMTFSLAAKGTFDAVGRAYEDYQNGTLGWHNALDIGLNGFALTGLGYMFQKGMGDALNGNVKKGLVNWFLEHRTPINNGGFVDPKAIKALFSKSGRKTTTPGFDNWLNKGASDNKVYFAIDENGDFIYTGITKQLKDVRLKQHQNKGKPFADLVVQYDGLTRNQARAIEQYFIEKPNGPNRENQIFSIRKKHRYYDDARNWAMEFLGVEE